MGRIFIVSYEVYGSIYHFRTTAENKRQAKKFCCNAMGCNYKDIVDVWEDKE